MSILCLLIQAILLSLEFPSLIAKQGNIGFGIQNVLRQKSLIFHIVKCKTIVIIISQLENQNNKMYII